MFWVENAGFNLCGLVNILPQLFCVKHFIFVAVIIRSMKKSLSAILIILMIGCSDTETIQPASTVDSNTVVVGDSTPAILHLDDARKDSSFTVALDTMVPAITAEDTMRRK